MTLWWFQLWMIIFMILKTKNTSDQYKDLRFIPSPHHELRATSYKLISLRVAFIARVTSYECYFYCTSYVLLFACELRATIYWTSRELLFTYELQVTVYCTSYELFLLHKLRVIVYFTSYELLLIAPVASYLLHAISGLIFVCQLRVTF